MPDKIILFPAYLRTRRGFLHGCRRFLYWDEMLDSLSERDRARIADGLNVLQFLTIRRYLSLVFFALVALLFGLAIWP